MGTDPAKPPPMAMCCQAPTKTSRVAVALGKFRVTAPKTEPREGK